MYKCIKYKHKKNYLTYNYIFMRVLNYNLKNFKAYNFHNNGKNIIN